jgi:hypothetical protein
MDELSCQQFRNLAPELALDILAARERGLALRHLEGCARCSDTLYSLTEVADGLVGSLPEAQPPAGFENRVVASFTPSGGRRPRGLARPVLAGTVSLIGAAAVVGAVLVGAVPPGDGSDPRAAGLSEFDGSGERTVQYAPLLRENQQVGQAYLYRGDPQWMYLSLDASNSAPDAGTLDCEVVHDDGTVTRVGSVTLDQGKAAWGGPAPVPPDSVVAARVVDRTGHTLAVARFRPRARNASTTTTSTTARPDPAENSDHDGRREVMTGTGQRPG